MKILTEILIKSLHFKFSPLFTFRRLFGVSSKNISKDVQDQLQIFRKSKLDEFTHINNLLENNVVVNKELIEKYHSLKPIVEIFNDLDLINSESEFFRNIKDQEEDAEIKELAELEKEQIISQTDALYNKLIDLIIPKNDLNNCTEVTLEILSGAGGQEAMLFAEELLSAYQQLAIRKQWIVECINCQNSELGGVRSCKFNIVGNDVYDTMKYESGIHRVQRIPMTSSVDKVHTSTVAVVVLPFEDEEKIEIKESDLKWETFRASGPGGQRVNKIDSAVRLTHIPTKTVVGCQIDRLQQANKATALKQLTNILYEKYLEDRLQKINANRRIAIGSRARSEKIRTYNYQQDRITEHRIHKSWSNISQVMEQGKFEPIITSLQEADLLDQLQLALQTHDMENIRQNK